MSQQNAQSRAARRARLHYWIAFVIFWAEIGVYLNRAHDALREGQPLPSLGRLALFLLPPAAILVWARRRLARHERTAPQRNA